MSRARSRATDLGQSWDDVTADSDDSIDLLRSRHTHQRDNQQTRADASSCHTYDRLGQPDNRSEFHMPTMQDSRVSTTWPVRRVADAKPRQRRQPPPSVAAKSSVNLSKEQRQTSHGVDLLTFTWNHVVRPTLAYIFSTLGMMLEYAKPLIAFALLTYCVYALWTAVKSGMTASIHAALSPVCMVPGATHVVPFCADRNGNGNSSQLPLEFSNLVQAQSSFEDVLLASADSAGLPQDMKRSETSIRDLKSVVEYSNLPSRHELVLEFQGFAETARKASDDLTRYNTRIAKAVDRILSTNKWTLQVLDGIAETEASRGHIVRFIQNNLNPFAPLVAAQSLSQTILFDQYIKHTSAIEEQIVELILEATNLLKILHNLDHRLDLIASISQRDGVRIEGNQDVLLGQLWSRLGGNRAEKKRYAAQLGLLDDVGRYRKLAIAHVSRTVLKLQAIAANLEDLRERVARPEVVGIRAELPLEMHIREIMMGVERLEAVRDQGREIEGHGMQKRLAIDMA